MSRLRLTFGEVLSGTDIIRMRRFLFAFLALVFYNLFSDCQTAGSLWQVSGRWFYHRCLLLGLFRSVNETMLSYYSTHDLNTPSFTSYFWPSWCWSLQRLVTITMSESCLTTFEIHQNTSRFSTSRHRLFCCQIYIYKHWHGSMDSS